MNIDPFLRSKRLSRVAMGLVGICLAALAGASEIQTKVSVLPALTHSTLVGPTASDKVLYLNLCLKEAQPGALAAFVDDVSNPESAHYRQFLSPAEIGARFGQPLSAINEAVSYLQSHGLQVTLNSDDRMHVTVKGTVAQVEAAFGTQINEYHSNDPHESGHVDYFAYATPPKLPASIAPIVEYVGGLQNWNIAVPATTLTPQMEATLYNTTPILNSGLQGQGRTVAFSNWDGYRVSNVPLYVNHFGLPAPTAGAGSNVQIIPVDGGSGTGNPGGEGDLDLQMLVGQAPLSTVLIYDGGGMLDVLTKEVNDNLADVISESWAWGIDSGTANAAHTLHQEMSAEGITYFAASGDWGTSVLNANSLFFPQIDPEVTVVGGTAAQTTSTGTRVSEIGWSGSGGGWSTLPFTWNVLPTWQKGTGVPTNINYRLVPDIAAHAVGDQPFTYNAVYIYYDGSLSSISGTSDASPMQAGQLAIAEQKLIQTKAIGADKYGHYRMGRINDRIYKMNGRSDVYYDVTVGNNGLLPNGSESSAGIGWDPVTGWGSTNWNGFVGAVVPPVKLIPTSATIYSGPPAQGQSPTGSVASLGAQDNIYYSIESVTAPAGQVAAAQLTFTLSAAPSTLAGLNLTLVTEAESQVTQFVYLYNYQTGQWDTSGAWTQAMTGLDKTLNISIDPTKYVGPGNVVKVINRGVLPPRAGSAAFRLNTDEAILVESF